jgi:hypothetical protein
MLNIFRYEEQHSLNLGNLICVCGLLVVAAQMGVGSMVAKVRKMRSDVVWVMYYKINRPAKSSQ